MTLNVILSDISLMAISTGVTPSESVKVRHSSRQPKNGPSLGNGVDRR